MSDLLTRVRQTARARQSGIEDRYRAAVRAAAAGQDVEPEQILGLLAEADVGPDRFAADVEIAVEMARLKRVIADSARRAEVYRKATAAVQSAVSVSADEVAAAEKALAKLKADGAAKIAAAKAVAGQASAAVSEADAAAVELAALENPATPAEVGALRAAAEQVEGDVRRAEEASHRARQESGRQPGCEAARSAAARLATVEGLCRARRDEAKALFEAAARRVPKFQPTTGA